MGKGSRRVSFPWEVVPLLESHHFLSLNFGSDLKQQFADEVLGILCLEVVGVKGCDARLKYGSPQRLGTLC